MSKNCRPTCHHCISDRLTMPVFRAVALRALLTCCGLIDSWMLSMPPFDVSNLATAHLINIPGWKMFGSESISCRGTSSDGGLFFVIIIYLK